MKTLFIGLSLSCSLSFNAFSQKVTYKDIIGGLWEFPGDSFSIKKVYNFIDSSNCIISAPLSDHRPTPYIRPDMPDSCDMLTLYCKYNIDTLSDASSIYFYDIKSAFSPHNLKGFYFLFKLKDVNTINFQNVNWGDDNKLIIWN